MECETLQDNEVTTGRLRRCSSVDQPNVALLLENNTPTAADNAATDDVQDTPASKTGRPPLKRMSSMEEIEMASCKLEPRIEGRIVIISPETLPELLSERQEWEHKFMKTIRESVEL